MHKFEGNLFVYATESALWWTNDATLTVIMWLKGVSLIYFLNFLFLAPVDQQIANIS